MPAKGAVSELSVAPLWLQPLRWLAAPCVFSYYHLAYRIRGWGALPRQRGPTLLVINHQHEIESTVIVSDQTIQARAWRYPIFTVSSRRMWEPGFMAERIPWLRLALRTANWGPVFASIGLQPIENELHSRPLVGLADAIVRRHGDLPISVVFRESVPARLPSTIQSLGDVLKAANFSIGRTYASLSELREPYRGEALEQTRLDLDADTAHFERLVRDGATLFLAPEGFYSKDGKMQRFRGILPRLLPLARVWLAGISYDPFVGRRLALFYRLQPSKEGVPFDVQLKAMRPVTTSALLATWLAGLSTPFEGPDALRAVESQLASLPPVLFVEPDLRKNPARMVHAALDGLSRLGISRAVDGRFELTGQRAHPSFPGVADIIAHQANFHAETLDGAQRSGSSSIASPNE